MVNLTLRFAVTPGRHACCITVLALLTILGGVPSASAQRQLERLGRGVTAFATGSNGDRIRERVPIHDDGARAEIGGIGCWHSGRIADVIAPQPVTEPSACSARPWPKPALTATALRATTLGGMDAPAAAFQPHWMT
jgi:hypothetical protein